MPKAGEKPIWRLLDTGPAGGAWNLALDEAIFRLAERQAAPPTIRLYSWTPPALSVGCFQRWEREIDPDACRRNGIAVYRRVTGGKAVFHDAEITYSVVSPRSGKGFPEGLLESYERIADALAAGLGFLGIDATLAPPRRRGRGVPGSSHASCFAATSGHEIAVDGKKLVGSAQKRGRKAMLQHGSLLVSPHNDDLASLLRAGEAKPPPTSSLVSAMGRRPSCDEVVSALRRGFEQAWNVSLVEASPLREEKELAQRLAGKRYRSLTQ